MAKDDTNDWAEIDVSGKKQDGPKVDFEIETPPDLAADKAEDKGEVKKPEPTGDEDLGDVQTAGAQKRIKQLLRRAKEAEERAARAEQELGRATAVIHDGAKHIVEAEAKTIELTEKQVQDKLSLARDAFKKAHESGDSDSLVKAQEMIADATADLKLLHVRKGFMEERRAKETKTPAEAPARTASPVSPSRLAKEWSEKNDWFGEDDEATGYALTVDAVLKREGFDPNSPEFYTEVDRRVAKRFPEHYKGAASRADEEEGQETRKRESRPSQQVAGQSRTPAPKKVKLSQDDVRLAQKWGIPLERMAAEKLKFDIASETGDYTNIQLGAEN